MFWLLSIKRSICPKRNGCHQQQFLCQYRNDLVMAVEQEYDELNMAIKMFQDTMMRVRYSGIPVVVVYGMTFGGGCEMSLHADKVVAAAETYIWV
jgi:enoyl-CoA hydratase/carnithine racemase